MLPRDNGLSRPSHRGVRSAEHHCDVGVVGHYLGHTRDDAPTGLSRGVLAVQRLPVPGAASQPDGAAHKRRRVHSDNFSVLPALRLDRVREQPWPLSVRQAGDRLWELR
eukprot:210779-Rhodomonas_salina.4